MKLKTAIKRIEFVIFSMLLSVIVIIVLKNLLNDKQSVHNSIELLTEMNISKIEIANSHFIPDSENEKCWSISNSEVINDFSSYLKDIRNLKLTHATHLYEFRSRFFIKNKELKLVGTIYNSAPNDIMFSNFIVYDGRNSKYVEGRSNGVLIKGLNNWLRKIKLTQKTSCKVIGKN